MGAIVNLFKWGVIIVVGFVVIGLFMDNAASWGQNVGGFFTAIQTFLSNLLSSSPLN